MLDKMMLMHDPDDLCMLSDLADINLRWSISNNAEARCIDIAYDKFLFVKDSCTQKGIFYDDNE